MTQRHFIMYTSMLKEFKSYETDIDYEYIFNELDDDTKNDLELLTSYYFIDIAGDNVITNLITLPCVKNISNLPIKIKLYYVKDYKLFPIQTEPTSKKLGISIFLPQKEVLNLNDTDGMLQNISFIIKNNVSEDEFKNYLYNILFYAHIITENFIFHPLLKYIYHYDDIDYLVHLKNVHIRLFGERNDCSVCMEETTGKTICKHNLCQKCYCGLQTKKCPICRKVLYDENDIYESVTAQFFIN